MAKLNDTTIEGDLNVSGTLYIGGGDTGASYPGIRWPIETWHKDDYTQWYVKYNDGWKECGGIHSTTNNANNSIPFPLNFTTKVCSLTTSYLSEGSRDNPALVVTPSINLSLTGFTCINKAGSGFTGISYRAEGY